MSPEEEEVAVLFQAAILGRTDILNKVVSNLRTRNYKAEDIAHFLSLARIEDGYTSLHIASAAGHQDFVRAVLVSLLLAIRVTHINYLTFLCSNMVSPLIWQQRMVTIRERLPMKLQQM